MKFIKEGMAAGFEGLVTGSGDVLQQTTKEIEGLGGDVLLEDGCPSLSAVRGKADGVGALSHGFSLFLCGSTKDLDNFDKLLLVVLALEEGFTKEHLSKDATDRPGVDGGGVVGAAEDEFGGAVVTRTDVGDVGFGGVELLGGTEITDLEGT